MQRTARAKLMLTGSMFVFGTIGIFVRNIPLSSGAIALCRALLAAALISVVLLIKRENPFKGVGKALPWLLLSGAAMGFNWILLFEAYKHTTVSVATLSYYFAPVIVILVCPLLFSEKMGIKQWICFVASTAGIVLITGIGDLSKGNNHLLGIAFGLGAAALYATVILLNKFIKTVEGLHRTFLQFLASIAVLLPYVMLTGGIEFSALSSKGITCLLIVGLLHTGVTYCLYFSSLKELSGVTAAVLSYIDPLVAVLSSVFILREEMMSPLQLLGGAMILGFTLWNELPSRKKT